MKIATFNVNGINARLPRLLEWLAGTRPDAVVLQEIKCETAKFPVEAVKAAGYRSLVLGQKGFNGVAVLAADGVALELLGEGLPGDPADEQARFIEARVGDVHLAGLYLPNGNPVPGPKFDYKLAWMDRLEQHAARLMALDAPVVMAGDWNVCPTDLDLARPDMMSQDALCQPESRAAFRRILAQGWTDAVRARWPVAPLYTYWDYQAGARSKNWGLRIDHMLLSPALADRLVEVGIDESVRDAERASDHVPVWVEVAAA